MFPINIHKETGMPLSELSRIVITQIMLDASQVGLYTLAEEAEIDLEEFDSEDQVIDKLVSMEMENYFA